MPDTQYGPMVKASQAFDVAVNRSYGGDFNPPVIWRGSITIFMTGSPLFDIEATLLESKQGGDPYVSWPQRQYKAPNGDTKYKNMVWCHDRDIASAAAEAVKRAIGYKGGQQQDFDPLSEIGD